MNSFLSQMSILLDNLLDWGSSFFNWIIATPLALFSFSLLIFGVCLRFFKRLKQIIK